mgnify:CR=1 FL=1
MVRDLRCIVSSFEKKFREHQQIDSGLQNWNELKNTNIFDPNDYYSDNINMEIIPIIPVQQQPELNQFLSGKKHIVYDKIGMSYEDIWLLCCEKILFTVYSTDVSDIYEIRNLMTDLFRRMDDSAKDLNKFNTEQKLKFHSIHVVEISPISPSEELQGFLSADIILEVKCARITGPDGRFI